MKKKNTLSLLCKFYSNGDTMWNNGDCQKRFVFQYIENLEIWNVYLEWVFRFFYRFI